MPRRKLTEEERAEKELARRRAWIARTPEQREAERVLRSDRAARAHERRRARARSKLRAMAGLPCEHEVLACAGCGEPLSIEAMIAELLHRATGQPLEGCKKIVEAVAKGST